MAKRQDRQHALTGKLADIVLRDGLGEFGLRSLAARLETSDRMLLYYFGSKDHLVASTLAEIGLRLTALLARNSDGPPLAPGAFLVRVLTLAGDPDIAPYMRLWAEVIARAARAEQPYATLAPEVVRGWVAWIDGRLVPARPGEGAGRAAAILAIVEGIMLLQTAAPGSAAEAGAYLSRMLGSG